MECEHRGLLYRGSPNNVEVRLYMAAFRHHIHSANIQNCNQPQGKGSKYDDTVHFGAENHYSGYLCSVCSWNDKKGISSHWDRHHVPTGGFPILIF